MAANQRKPNLTPKQAKFVQEYLIDMNATAAAIRAGYSEKTAYAIGWNLLKKVEIQEALAFARQEASAKSGVTPEKVIACFYQIANMDLSNCYNEDGTLKNIHDIPEDTRKAIAGLEVLEKYTGEGDNRELVGFTKKVKCWDKVKALDSLAKHFGLYNSDKSQQPTQPFILNLMLSSDDKEPDGL